MDLCDINQIKYLLTSHGFHFSKAKGQNFLIQSWVPERIAEESGAGADCGVLEIGPGIGCLTKQLCLRAGKVCAIEVDTSLKPILEQTIGEFENITIIFADVLKINLHTLVEEQFPGKKPIACANLPYYITSPILSALLESRLFSSITVMVQKEVAQRICAKPGTADYSAFSVFCQYYSIPEILFDVPPHCFIPQPKVTSSVIRLTLRSEPPCTLLNEEVFFKTVRAGFAMRRKTACNALAAGFSKIGKAEICKIIEACGHNPNVRCETFDIPQFAAIANEIYRREENV